LWIVDIQHGDRGAADRGSTDKHESHPFKVALPALSTGIEEADDPVGERVSAAQVWFFVEIAPVAAPAAIVVSVDAAMLLCQDMFEMKTGCGHRVIGNVAVFASATGPFADELTKGPLHSASFDRFSNLRALA
jgi:hypothetical protein